MDEVLEKLESTLIGEKSDDQNKTNFDGLYKYWGKLGNQEKRRREILEVQKSSTLKVLHVELMAGSYNDAITIYSIFQEIIVSNRNNKLDKFRGILELVTAVEEGNIFQPSYKAYYRPTIYVAGFHRTSPTYSNVLMMSEWLVEKPVDFHDNWYVTPCPKGVRMLVISSQGSTKCYTKFGHFKEAYRTALPGGNPCDPKRKNQCCVLDCFYQEKNNTMYVLDLLAWKTQPMTDGEAEFRHYWLETQMSEIPDLKVINKRNKLIFKLLPKVPCTLESLNKFMMSYPHFDCNFPTLDGLLFYHKKAHYVSGETPLVGWLFPFMVPEILGADITVSRIYLIEKPENYIDQADFIRKFEAKFEKKKIKSLPNSMDTMQGSKIESHTEKSKSTVKLGGGNANKTPEESESMEDEVNVEQKNYAMEEETAKDAKEKCET